MQPHHSVFKPLFLFILILFSIPTLAAAALEWLTYRNEEARISFLYPKSATIHSHFANNYFASSKNWRFAMNKSLETKGQQIVSVRLIDLNNLPLPNHDQGYYRVEMRVGMNQNRQAVANCIMDYTSHEKINNIKFHKSKSIEAGMTQTLEVKSYHALYDHTCYVIDVFTAYRDGVNKLNLEKQYAIATNLKKMLQSFRFIEPSKR